MAVIMEIMLAHIHKALTLVTVILSREVKTHQKLGGSQKKLLARAHTHFHRRGDSVVKVVPRLEYFPATGERPVLFGCNPLV